jgi:aminoglycoside phosphotransferase family enzyme
MGIMLDDMKRFTHELRGSIKDRKIDLRHIEKATEECLEGARGFVAQIGAEHREMAEQQGLTLAANRTELLDRVAAMRGQNQEQIARMRDELRKSLARDTRNLKKSVATFRARCKKEQTHLAGELRQVAKTWAKLHHHAS